MLLMAKSTFSTGPFSIEFFVCLPEGKSSNGSSKENHIKNWGLSKNQRFCGKKPARTGGFNHQTWGI